MMDCRFFYPNGEEIKGKNLEEKKEKFLDFYSNVYYYVFRDLKLEKQITGILYDHNTLDEEDIQNILKWKTSSEYKDGEITGGRYKSIDSNSLQALYDILKGPKMSLKMPLNTDKTKIISKLTELLDVNNIGPVYAITLMSFLTNGQLPIYDKFAHIALKVIENKEKNKKPFDIIITDSQLNKEFHKGTKDIDKLYNEYHDNYISRLNKIFGEDYINDRHIDQALWVYGHLFNDNKTNKNK